MYIRRKVFSLLQDENGEEKYFSTTEFVREDSEEKLFAKKEDDEKSGKGKKAAIITGAAVAPVALAGGYQLARRGQKKYDDKKSAKANAGDGSQSAYKASKRKLERSQSNIVKTEEAINEGVRNAAKKTKETVVKAKDATVNGAKKAGNFLERAWKGETNGFSRDAQGYARKNGRFAKESAMKKNAYKNRALMIGGTAATVATPIVAAKLAKKNKKENKD